MKRTLFAEAMVELGLVSRLMSMRRRTTTPWLTTLTYHRVVDDSVWPLDPDVTTPAGAFEQQLAYVTRTFDLVGLDDVLGFLRGRSLPPSPLLITFDDGYRDNHDVALPLLAKYGARATFFVATAYVDERRLYWWDRIHYALKKSPRATVELRYPHALSVPLGSDPARRGTAIARVLQIVKERYDLDLPRFLDHLDDASGVAVTPNEERALADRHVMTWDHVRALRRAGMDVASHTHTHRVLETLRPAELAMELHMSRALLEDVLGESVQAISYPVGRADTVPEPVRRAVRAARYEAAFSNHAGVSLKCLADPLDLRRIPVEGVATVGHFQTVMAVPLLAY
jgi:peptidoglycan/xylan/chitin deacetylase (PgdA/CDA1 family)